MFQRAGMAVAIAMGRHGKGMEAVHAGRSKHDLLHVSQQRAPHTSVRVLQSPSAASLDACMQLASACMHACTAGMLVCMHGCIAHHGHARTARMPEQCVLRRLAMQLILHIAQIGNLQACTPACTKLQGLKGRWNPVCWSLL